jgi:putative DNA primase/helicase
MDIISELVAKLQEQAQTRYSESIPSDVPIDGNIHRYGSKKKDFWCVGHVWPFKGKDYAVIKYGHWKYQDGTQVIKSFEKTELKNKSFLKEYTKVMEDLANKHEQERKDNFESCVAKYKPIWKSADPESLHNYLIEKGIDSPFGSRIDSKGVMLVPLYTSEGKFGGVQRIYFNPETQQFDKRFAFGSWIKGSIFPLQKFSDSELVYVCEGFSTACSIQTAFPNIPVIVAFNAGNLYPAIQTIRNVNAGCKIIICADRDKESGTGERFARKCVKDFSSCIYKLPFFQQDNGKWSDYNDLHRFNGLNSVKEQLIYKPSDFVIIQPLGVNGDMYYFMSSENPQPIEIKGSNLKEHFLYNLVPDYNWWLKNYPKFDRDDEDKIEPTGVNWVLAANDLRKKCLKEGKFKYSNQRSSGVWFDDGQYLFHNGFKLHNGKTEIDLFSNKLTKNYVMGSYCQSLEKYSTLTENERKALTEIFGSISTKTKEHGLLLLGWLASAPIAGAMPWRPHVWLTGESSAGKSWTMENIIGVILDGFCIRPQGDSSEAGIRQAVGNQSLPLVFDEMETDNEKTSNRVEGVVALARQASTPTSGDIMRGTAGGSVQTFSPNFSLIVSSINPNLLHKQDKKQMDYNRILQREVIK